MRQLVAILFADMVGYTSLMQQNEQLACLKRTHFEQVLGLEIPKYNGKTLQQYGDGSLNIFTSAIQAVKCAIEIQRLLKQEPTVDLRIGIHVADVTIQGESIYGDGVNLASRIESVAVPGSVLISEKVFDEVKNQQDIITQEVGYFEFKNVLEPTRVFAIANDGLVVPARDEVQGKTTQPQNRLAVLPFVNMSPDPENEFFSDGITEELLNALTKVDGLQVTSRTSAFAFKGKNDDIREIGARLNVDKILEGSVRKAGNRVRITAQLINAADGYHIWSENFDRNLTDIFALQDEISAIIANKLKDNLLSSTPPHLPVPAQSPSSYVKAPTQNIDAYTSYLKGLHYWNKVTPADTRKAIECFEQAVSLEPHYAQAYAMAACAYSYLGSTGQMLPKKAFEMVDHYADKALELDSNVADGYVAKASTYLFYEWKWQAAYNVLQKALHLNRGATAAYQLLAFYYVITGQKDEAVRVMEYAVQLDPLSSFVNQYLGNTYIFAERYDDAIRQADKLLEINPHMRISIELKAWGIGMKGDWEEALKLFEEVHVLTKHPLKGLMGVGYACAKLGLTDRALECIRKIEQRQKEDPDSVVDGDLVGIWYALGNLDKVFYHIDQCVIKRTAPVNFFLEYPAFKGLKNDPRCKALLKKAAEQPIPS